MDQENLTHASLASLLQVSQTTVKSYRRKFPEFIPVAAQGKPLRFDPEAAPACRLIRDCFAQGLSVEETRRRLAARFPAAERASRTRPAREASGSDSLVRAVDRLAQRMEDLAEAQARIEARLDRLLAQAPGQGPEESAARRVAVRNVYGEVQEYIIKSRPAQAMEAPSPAAAESRAAGPPSELRGLPLALRTEDGEFLGAAGKSRAPFTPDELLALLDRSLGGAGRAGQEWTRAGDGWRLGTRCRTEDGPQALALTLRRVQTPRGNDVALVTGLSLDQKPAPAAHLYALITQLRERQDA